MNEREALAELDALLDLDAGARSAALARLAQHSPEAAATVASWLAADSREEPRLVPGHYTPLVPPIAGDPDVAVATAGDRIGPYRLVREIGRGGMGSVWLAERVDADFAQAVALKLIRPDLASPEAEPRFRRERQILASLKHPNIAQLLDGGVTADGRPWLAMEHIDGISLRERLRNGPLPAEQLASLASQVSSALAHAHAAGVVHRDLKPDNVLLSREGYAKVLDFGVAKLLRDDAAHVPGTASSTRPGHVIGTTPYMSPEQAAGERVDFRSDQFAFGALLYEAATATSAFSRPTPSETIAAVLRDAPPQFDALVGKLPPGMLRVLRRCLEKDPARRYGATSDLARDLAEVERGEATAERRAQRRAVPLRVVAALAFAAALALGWWLGRTSAPEAGALQAPRRVSAEIPISPAERLYPGAFAMHALALSPDGTRLVFGGVREGRRLLYARALDAREATALPGSEGGSNPVFSPDGEWVAFFANQKLKKIPFGGGTATVLAEAPNALGGIDWPAPGRIVYSPHPSTGIWEVAAEGGEPTEVTVPDAKSGEGSHVWPHEVRGTQTLLYVVEVEPADSFDAGRIVALDRASGKRRVLIDGGSDPRVVGDTLYYARASTIYAVGYDRAGGTLRGSPRPVLESVMYTSAIGAAHFDHAAGVTVYAHGASSDDAYELVIVDRQGNAEPLGIAPGAYARVRLNRDGTRAVLQITQADDDVWVLDLARRTLTRVTDQQENLHPTWMPDGQHVVYAHHGTPAPPPPTLYRRHADGSGEPEQLLAPGVALHARLYLDASPDGRTLAYSEYSKETNFDIWLFDMETRKPRRWLSTPMSDITPRFSPDGRFIAYGSYPTMEAVGDIYVLSLDGERRWQVTNQTGSQPAWRRDGRELFFMRAGAVYSVALGEGDDLAPGVPRELFRGDYAHRYDVFPDGQRFLLLRRVPDPAQGKPLRLELGELSTRD